jgi:hypothetical protein
MPNPSLHLGFQQSMTSRLTVGQSQGKQLTRIFTSQSTLSVRNGRIQHGVGDDEQSAASTG